MDNKNTATGKAALLIIRGAESTENCACCGKFLPADDRLPTSRGLAHFVCVASKAVR